MAWDEDSFKAGFTMGRFLWNTHVKYSQRRTPTQQVQNNQNEEEGEDNG